MALLRLFLKPGVDKQNTEYGAEGGWVDSDYVRFRYGLPEKIGGWTQFGNTQVNFVGSTSDIFTWNALNGSPYAALGTNRKVYVFYGGAWADITPIRATGACTFTTTNGSTTVVVNDAAHGAVQGDFVTFSGATGTYDTIFNAEYQITVLTADTYTITTSTVIAAGSYGGAAVVAAYQINIGQATVVPILGWGAGAWGAGPWGEGGGASTVPIRLWSQANFGEDLVFAFRGGPLYYWDNTSGLATRGVLVSSLAGASDVPVALNFLIVSAINRFVFCFGTNDYGTATQNPMLLRWSDQEDITMWTPAATNQAGSLLLSHGSKIVTAIQTRQEIVVLTDSALYSLQYQGPPAIWSSQLLGDNISIASPNAIAIGSGVIYWMGVDKFYKYDGRLQTLRCDLLKFIFEDINLNQQDQFFASTNEGFTEIWFFYCSSGATEIDRYAIYNYTENNGAGVWYYGAMARTAWLDSGLRNNPMAATTINNVVYHELGNDDNSTETSLPISSVIETTEFDIDDGDHFGFVWRMLPDITFVGSDAASPQVTMTLIPMQNSGSGYNDPISVGGNSNATVVRTATVPIEEFTGQVYVRVRGRQMIMKVENNQLGCAWQLGSPRIDIKQDGRRGNS